MRARLNQFGVKILDLYIMHQVAIPAALSIRVITLVLIVARLLKRVDLVVNQGVALGRARAPRISAAEPALAQPDDGDAVRNQPALERFGNCRGATLWLRPRPACGPGADPDPGDVDLSPRRDHHDTDR